MALGYRVSAKGDRKAEILIYEDVGEGWFGGVSAKQFAVDLKTLGEVKTIDLRINSYGGDVFDGLAIYRLLVEHKAVVIAHIDGIAASIASVIAMSGDEIIIAEAGEIMIHEAWGIAIGPPADMRAVADRLEAVSASIADVYVSRTGQPKTQIQEWMKAETTFQSADAVKHGFAQSIAPNLKFAARQELSRLHWRRAPPHANDAKIDAPLRLSAEEELKRMRATLEYARINQNRGAGS